MTGRRCLAAFTPPGSNYPPYVNISQYPNGEVEITVRSPAGEGGSCGTTSAFRMPLLEFSKVIAQAASKVRFPGVG